MAGRIVGAVNVCRVIVAISGAAVLIPLQALWFFAAVLIAAACGAIGYGGYCIYQAARGFLTKRRS